MKTFHDFIKIFITVLISLLMFFSIYSFGFLLPFLVFTEGLPSIIGYILIGLSLLLAVYLSYLLVWKVVFRVLDTVITYFKSS